jgi:hypothetical protein
MTKFQYAYNSLDIDVTHITIDDLFDVTLIRRETGIEIDILEFEGDTTIAGCLAPNPARDE